MSSAPHPALRTSRAPRLVRLAAAVCAAALVAGVIPGGWGSAAAAHAVTGPDEPADPARLVLAPEDPVVREDTDAVTFDVLVDNPGDTELPAGSVELHLGDDPLTAAGLDAPDDPALTGDTVIGLASVEATPGAGQQQTTIEVPRAELPQATFFDSGVYRVDATFTPEAESAAPLTATSQLVWRAPSEDGDVAAVPVSVIVPLVLPSEVPTLPTRAQLQDLVPQWEELLVAARVQRGTLAIDPRVIAGIRAYGSNAPQEAQDFLYRLETTVVPTFLLQFADADPAAQADLGFSKLLAPANLDFTARYGSFADPATPEAPGPDATEDATTVAGDAPYENEPTREEDPATQLPSATDLTAWEGETPTAWPAPGAADDATLALLADAGISTFVLSDTNVSAADGPIAALDDGTAIVTDTALDAAAREAMGGATSAERLAGSAELAARLALHADDGTPGVVIGLDRGATGDSGRAPELLADLGGWEWAAGTAVADQATGSGTFRATGSEETRTELLAAATNRESSVSELGAVLAEPQYLGGYQRARLLELFSTRHATADFADIADQYRLRDAELLEGVQVVSTEHTQLVGTSTNVPVQIHNSLPFTAVVTVKAAPASAALALTDRTFTEIAVPAGANEQVMVPVRSRVSSGESGLVISVVSEDDILTVFTGTLPITIRASFETIAMWTIGVLAILLLGFGVWRSVRRKRKADPSPAE